MIGDATKIEEYVPINNPMIRAKEKPRIGVPPNRKRIRATMNTVNTVIIVLLNVWLIESFTF